MHETEKKFQEINFFKLTTHLEDEEGFRSKAYDDATGKEINFSPVCRGNPTIGIGLNLKSGITKEEALAIAEIRLRALNNELIAQSWYRAASTPRKEVLLEMAFNMGIKSLFGFRRMLAYMKDWEWELAGEEILNSEAARMLPSRYSRMHKKWMAG